MFIKIQNPGSHNLNEICPCLFRLQNTLMKFHHCGKTFSHNRAIMPFFMNGKYRSSVIYSILWCKLFRSRRNTQRITTITYKNNSPFLVCFQMLSYDLIVRSIFMHLNCMAVIHAIHNDMRMTFSKHFLFLFLFPAAFLTQSIESDG